MMWQWHARHDPGCERALMERYWDLLLSLCGIVLISAVAFALWSIVSPWEPEANPAAVSQDSVDTLRREQIQAVLDLYEQRKLQFEKAKSEPVRVADPA